MKRYVFIAALLIFAHINYEAPCYAEISDKPQDTKELMYQDMLMLFLLPHINKKIDEIYSDILTVPPVVYPYFVHVVDAKRTEGFRGYRFQITLEVVPVVGPHIPVGKDRITFDISPIHHDNVRLIGWRHMEGPSASNIPPNWRDILK